MKLITLVTLAVTLSSDRLHAAPPPADIRAQRCKANDNYCDCGDDETKTAACSLYSASKRTFQCNDPTVLQMLFQSRVHDTVCDCCDGSDELPSTGCPNTCQRLARDVAAEREEEKARRLKGMEEREVQIKEAVTKLTAIRTAGGDSVNVLLQQQREPLVRAKAALEEEEKLEKNHRLSIVSVATEAFNTYFSAFTMVIQTQHCRYSNPTLSCPFLHCTTLHYTAVHCTTLHAVFTI